VIAGGSGEGTSDIKVYASGRLSSMQRLAADTGRAFGTAAGVVVQLPVYSYGSAF
jgi:hypothetical protein